MNPVIFNDQNAAYAFRRQFQHEINDLIREVENVSGILQAEIWLCGNSASFIAGFDSEDQQVVSYPLHLHFSDEAIQGFERGLACS